jgi:hypothetical protein
MLGAGAVGGAGLMLARGAQAAEAEAGADATAVDVTEAGGQYVGPTQNHVLALAQELGVATYPGYNPGESVYVADGRATRYTGDIPPDLLALPDLAQMILRLDQMATKVPVDAPWTAPDAERLDGMTVETWIKTNTINSTRVLALVDLFLSPALGSRAADASMLFLLATIAGYGDEDTPGTLERGIGSKDAAQDSRLVRRRRRDRRRRPRVEGDARGRRDPAAAGGGDRVDAAAARRARRAAPPHGPRHAGQVRGDLRHAVLAPGRAQRPGAEAR